MATSAQLASVNQLGPSNAYEAQEIVDAAQFWRKQNAPGQAGHYRRYNHRRYKNVAQPLHAGQPFIHDDGNKESENQLQGNGRDDE